MGVSRLASALVCPKHLQSQQNQPPGICLKSSSSKPSRCQAVIPARGRKANGSRCTTGSLKPILLMAHQDVVPVNMGTESDWTGAPFAGEIIDGFVYGRGAIDDKGNLVALMEAADALAASGFQPKRTVLFMFGHDEEVLGSGAEAGVALLKSRGIEPEMVLDEGFMIIDPSPLSGKPMGIIGIAEKGYVTIEVTAIAQGGHSSTPPRNSANVNLATAILALEANQMPADFSNRRYRIFSAQQARTCRSPNAWHWQTCGCSRAWSNPRWPKTLPAMPWSAQPPLQPCCAGQPRKTCCRNAPWQR